MLIAAAIFIRRLKQSTGLDDYLRNHYLPTKKVPQTMRRLLRNPYPPTKKVPQTNVDCWRNLYLPTKTIHWIVLAT